MTFVYLHLSRLSPNIWAGAQFSPKPGSISRLRSAHHCQANKSQPTESPREWPGGSRHCGWGEHSVKGKDFTQKLLPSYPGRRHRKNRTPESSQSLFHSIIPAPFSHYILLTQALTSRPKTWETAILTTNWCLCISSGSWLAAIDWSVYFCWAAAMCQSPGKRGEKDEPGPCFRGIHLIGFLLSKE